MALASTSQLVQEEILRNMPEYESNTSVGIRKGVKQVTSHSPTNSETSIFSTVDCYSFSSRSDASSFAKEDTNASVNSSIENIPSGARLVIDETSTETKGSGYFEFSFLDEKARNGGVNSVEAGENMERALVKVTPQNIQDDSFEIFPVWTDRTKDIQTCHNPCFEDEPHLRTSRRKKFTRGLGSVLTKHLTLSPGPTFRRSSYDKFRARLALENPSPSSDNLVTGTPGRNFERKEIIRSGYMSSPGYMRRNMSSPRISFARGKMKVYGTSPKKGGCLGITSKTAEESVEDDSKGPLYFATEESVHGGKLLCLPSPRLSFVGSGKTGSSQQPNTTISMTIPSNTIHGQLHCIIRDELPSFTLLVDGLDEVLVAKAIHVENLECIDNVEYMFYSCKPKGRPKGNWKSWIRKHRSVPDVVAKMVISSRAVDGDDTIELECVVSDGKGSLSPRLSFSTWESGLSPHSSCKSPFYSFPSPFSIVSPSPGRMLSSRTPRTERGIFQDTWSDTEYPEVREQLELSAVIVRVNNDGTSIHSKWWKPAKRRNSYHRRLSLPGMFQVTETKENQDTLPLRQGSYGKSSKLRELMGVGPDFGRQPDRTDVTVVLPAGNHGLPLYGIGGPQPLVDRWRSGGRCDCGSWDLGCGLSILEGGHRKSPYGDQRGAIKMFMQGKKNECIMNVGQSDDGIFPVWFKAPMSYLQAFATAVAVVYSRGPDTCKEYSKEPPKESLTKPPRVPLKTLTSQSHVALSGYCSPPPPCLLDRL